MEEFSWKSFQETIDDAWDKYSVVIVACFVGALTLLVLVCCRSGQGSQRAKRKKAKKSVDETVVAGKEPAATSSEQPRVRFKPSQLRTARRHAPGPHPLLTADFKGHTGSVLSLHFELGGKYLASCSDDRSIRVWWMKTLQDKEHKYARIGIDFDHATCITFSPDATAVLASIEQANCVRVYRIAKHKGNLSLTQTLEFPLVASSPTLALGVATNGKFIMTCSEKSFTVWSLKGEVLSSVDTHQSPNTCAVISPCSSFIACSGFTPDVKIWEVKFSKTGDFQQVTRAMDLKGHSASVASVSFSQDAKRVATVSKDKTCRLWDIDVRYLLREDPKQLLCIQLDSSNLPSHVAYSPDGLVVGVAIHRSILFYSTGSGQLLETLDSVHNDDISCICWAPDGEHLASSGGEDRYIRLWRNTAGMRERIKDIKGKISTTSSEPLKERLIETLNKLQEDLRSLEQRV